MKKISILLSMALVASSFAFTSCDDDDEVKVEDKAKELVEENAQTADEDDFYILYTYETDWELDDKDVAKADPSQIPSKLPSVTTDVNAKAQILNEKDIEKYNNLPAIKALNVVQQEINGQLQAYLVFLQAKAGDLIAMETSDGTKGVAKVLSVSSDLKKISVKCYLAVPKE